MNTHKVGDVSEAHVLAALTEVYEAVLLPFGNGQRYDLVLDTGEDLLKVQVKTGRLRNGTIRFNASSRSQLASRDYKEDVDLFAIWCPETRKVYVVPIDHVTSDKPSLRVDPCKNGQMQGIRMASEYELQLAAEVSMVARVLGTDEDRVRSPDCGSKAC